MEEKSKFDKYILPLVIGIVPPLIVGGALVWFGSIYTKEFQERGVKAQERAVDINEDQISFMVDKDAQERQYNQIKDTANYQLELLKVFFNAFFDENQKKKNMALQILKRFDKDLQEDIAQIIYADETSDAQLKEKVKSILEEAKSQSIVPVKTQSDKLGIHDTVLPRINRIDIFFPTGDTKAESLAKDVESTLRETGYGGNILVRKRVPDWFLKDPPNKYLIRYDSGNRNEKQDANILSALLKGEKIPHSFIPSPQTGKKTENYLSVMINPSGE